MKLSVPEIKLLIEALRLYEVAELEKYNTCLTNDQYQESIGHHINSVGAMLTLEKLQKHLKKEAK
jgi:hypothetical protein